MDYDLFITYMGENMGITPIRLDQAGNWTLCDACYGLADEIGSDGHDETIDAIFGMLPDGDGNGSDTGYVNGATFKMLETGSWETYTAATTSDGYTFHKQPNGLWTLADGASFASFDEMYAANEFDMTLS